jgi:zinc transporter
LRSVYAGRHTLTAIEATRRVLRGGLKVTTPAVLLEVITQQMVEAVDHYAEDLANRLDRVEERILAKEVSFDRQIIGRVRRMSVRLHRQLVLLRSLIHRFEHDIERSSMSGVRLPTEKLIQRLDWPDTEIVELRWPLASLAGRNHAQRRQGDQSQPSPPRDRDQPFSCLRPWWPASSASTSGACR